MNSNDRAPEPVTTRVSVEGADMQMLAGVNDSNLVELGRATGTRVALRGDSLTITGDADNVARAEAIARSRPRFQPRAEWRAEMARRMGYVKGD